MATTTNYSWTTPDDTDLVKDGAAAIRTLGSSIDTSVKALSPGTTAGDVDYYTTSTAKARLGIGTAGQVLTVNSGATAPEWATISAGGMTLLSTTTLTGASTTISAISGSYNYLFGVVYGVTNATGNNVFRIAPNASTNISSSVCVDQQAIREITSGYFNLTGPQLGVNRTSSNNIWSFQIHNYASATNYKSFFWSGTYLSSTSGAITAINGGGGIETNSAITSLVFSNPGGNFSTGTVLLYGVK